MNLNPPTAPRRAKRRRPALLALAALALAGPAAADGGEWEHAMHLYLLGPTIEGTAGIGPVDGDVDVDAGTVFDNLEAAFLGMYSAERDRVGVFVDIVYMDLEGDAEGARGLVAGTLGNTQFTSMTAATWRLDERWRLMGGAMYTNVDMSIDTTGPITSRSADRSERWWDPYVGALFSTDVGEKWDFTALGTIGGFGVGSDLTWSASAAFARQLSERSSITFMYRYLDFDYEDGSGADRFKFDIAQHGPALGWRFVF